jgi:hypothetical protein
VCFQEVYVAFARRTWLFSLCLWLSLATVLGHALAPIGSPLTQKSGSAFSASTYDVSLAAQRAGVSAKLKRAAWPADDDGTAGPAPALAAETYAFAPPARAGALALPAPDAPLPLPRTRSGFDARAPPRA